MGRRGPTSGQRVGLLVGGTVALVGIAVAAAKVGPWVPRDPTPTPELTYTDFPDLTLTVLPQTPPAPPPAQSPAQSWDPTVLLLVLGALLLIALLVLLVRHWRSSSVPDEADEPTSSPAPEPPPPAERSGSPGRFDRRQVADEVIACWQWVETSALALGLGRGPAQTPTEFLGRVGAATGADPAACAQLLELYHHARFDHHALEPGSADRARTAAAQVVGSLIPVDRQSTR